VSRSGEEKGSKAHGVQEEFDAHPIIRPEIKNVRKVGGNINIDFLAYWE